MAEKIITQSDYEPLPTSFDQTLARIGHVNKVIRMISRDYQIKSLASTIDFITSSRVTIVTFDAQLTSSMTFTSSDITQCLPGDTLTICTVRNPAFNTINITFTQSFYITTCGGSDDPQVISIGDNERFTFVFIFDGEKWVNTFDNC